MGYLFGPCQAAIKMHYCYGTRTWGDGLFYDAVIYLQCIEAGLNQHGNQPILGYCKNSGNICVGRHNNLVAGFHNTHLYICSENPDKSIKTVGTTYGVLCTDELRVIFLKRLVLNPLQIPAALHYTCNRLIYFRLIQSRDIFKRKKRYHIFIF